MNINRKRSFLKLKRIENALKVVEILTKVNQTPPPQRFAEQLRSMHAVVALDAQMRLYRQIITDPFDVLDVTQMGYLPPTIILGEINGSGTR